MRETPLTSKNRVWLYPYLLIAPALAVMICVVFVPVGQALITSFMHYDLRYPSRTAFVGFANYVEAFTQDPQFWSSLRRTAVWVFFGVGFQFLFGFILAQLLNRSFTGRGLVRSLTLLPWVIPGVLIGLIWRWLYEGSYGVINDFLVRTGIFEQAIPFLARTNTAMPAAIVTIVWQGIPFFTLMILAGLQGIPGELYEAADIDGATYLHKLFRITVPSIRNTIAVAVMLRLIWVTNSVDIILSMTTGGPAYATQTIGIYVYHQARVLNLGYSSMLAVVMAVLMFVVVVPYMRNTLMKD
jgi:multiple sugar transport system permease protein